METAVCTFCGQVAAVVAERTYLNEKLYDVKVLVAHKMVVNGTETNCPRLDRIVSKTQVIEP